MNINKTIRSSTNISFLTNNIY